MTLPLRVALLGTGAIARSQHLPAWSKLPEFKMVALADASPVSLAAVPSEFQIERRVSDYRELLDDPDIDVVDICVPSALHSEVVIAALQAGKHVLCEKPMATSRADAAAMLAAWRASGKKLMIAQHMRFEPSVIQLRTYLERNSPGDVYYSRGQWLRRRRLPARPGFTDKRLSGAAPCTISACTCSIWPGGWSVARGRGPCRERRSTDSPVVATSAASGAPGSQPPSTWRILRRDS
jgi:predicted dehydrogenase